MEFIEASAKKNTNIQEAFAKLALKICEVKAQQQPSVLPDSEGDLTPSFTLPGQKVITLDDNEPSRSSCKC